MQEFTDQRYSTTKLILQYIDTLICVHMTFIMDADQCNANPCEVQTIMATKIQHRSMQRRLKLVHKNQTYNVDLCHSKENLSTTMNTQMWIHARNHTNTPSQPSESNEHLTNTHILQLVFNKVWLYPWLQCSEVKHGRNHLITNQWCEPLTSAREITINVNDSQGTLVQSTEYE